MGPGPKVLAAGGGHRGSFGVRRWTGFEGGALAAGGVVVAALVLVAERPTAVNTQVRSRS
jgi:hypothetical protein